jgi:hypothetical protein
MRAGSCFPLLLSALCTRHGIAQHTFATACRSNAAARHSPRQARRRQVHPCDTTLAGYNAYVDNRTYPFPAEDNTAYVERRNNWFDTLKMCFNAVNTTVLNAHTNRWNDFWAVDQGLGGIHFG